MDSLMTVTNISCFIDKKKTRWVKAYEVFKSIIKVVYKAVKSLQNVRGRF